MPFTSVRTSLTALYSVLSLTITNVYYGNTVKQLIDDIVINENKIYLFKAQ
jgi:hypothetical protein